MDIDTNTLEKEAHQLLSESRFQDAADAFHRAAQAHQRQKQHQAAALCLSSAAASLAMKAGEASFYQPALDYEKAAAEAIKANDLEYASVLFKQAAVCHEKDMDYVAFCECYYKSKEYQRKSLSRQIFHPSKVRNLKMPTVNTRRGMARSLKAWLELTFSSLLWGHGEKPQNAVYFGCATVMLFAVIYSQGLFIKNGALVRPDFLDSVYFSAITFITIGYGDLIPVGFNKCMAIVETLGGLFILPIFITGLCRKYLMF